MNQKITMTKTITKSKASQVTTHFSKLKRKN